MHDAPAARGQQLAEVELRPLRTHAEYLACVELQKETWGPQFTEAVPPSILKVVQRVGGLTAGAFDGEGRLLGFVFGISGIEEGRLVHWSDLLAVRREVRGLGLGKRLKEFQREYLCGLGVEVIYWTYDPLVARNAHLNLNRLGVEVAEYVPDMYAASASELHRGLGMDRFVVAWRIGESASGGARSEAQDPSGFAEAPVLNAAPDEEESAPPALTGPRVRIEIPRDIHQVQAHSLEAAARWRTSTRGAFLDALARGYRVVGFSCEGAAERCHYLLARPADPGGNADAAG